MCPRLADRLSTGDLMTFWAEVPGAPMHIALAAVLEPPAAMAIEGLRAELAARTTRVRELSRRVRWTRPGEGRPLLVDDERYRVEDHLPVLDPVALDDHRRFDQLAAERALIGLDRDRPLWRADLVPDTASDRVGVVLVLHHALADGIRGVALAATLFDATPTPAVRAAAPAPTPAPTPARLVADNLAGVADTARHAARLAGRRGRDHRRGGSDARTSLREVLVPATRTPLDGPLGPHRCLAVVRRPLDELRAAGRARGATVNDVLLAAVSGGMRQLLLARGVTVEGLSLRVSIPVASPPGARNAGGSMPIVTSMPVGDPDPEARLAAITRDLTVRKASRDRSYTGIGQSPLMPRFVMHGVTHLLRYRGGRMVNLYVTNVPGPREPLWLGPARLTRPTPIAPLVAGTRISVAALSYCGDLAIAVHTDASLAPIEPLAVGIGATLDALGCLPR